MRRDSDQQPAPSSLGPSASRFRLHPYLDRFLTWIYIGVGWSILISFGLTADWSEHWDLTLLLLVAGAWANYLKIEVGPVSINQAFAFELIAVLLLDPLRASLLGVSAYLCGTAIPERHGITRNLLNCAIIGVSVLTMGMVYEGLGGKAVLAGPDPTSAHALGAVMAASLVHFLINSAMVYSIILARRAPDATRLLLKTSYWDLLAKFVFAPLAFFVGVTQSDKLLNLVGPVIFILFIWILLKNYMELTQTRVELGRSVDSLHHLHTIAKALHSSLDLHQVLDTALAQSAPLAGTTFGAIFLRDRYTNDHYLSARLGDQPTWEAYLASPEVARCCQSVSLSGLSPGLPLESVGEGGFLLTPRDPQAHELGLRSLLAFPLRDTHDTTGVMLLGLREEARPETRALQSLSIVAMEITAAIENARLHETVKREIEKRHEELQLAEKIQRRILPKALERPGVRVATHFRPARTVGGDYFDLIELDDHRLGIVIGDVSGKGIPAAMTMMSVVNRIKVWANHWRHPDRVLELLNDSLLESQHAFDEVLQYSTAVFGILDCATRKFTYAMAGHERPFLLTGDSAPIPLEGEGYPLGLFPHTTYSPKTIQLKPGDRLIFYTDGIPDMQNKDGKRLGREGFIEYIQEVSSFAQDNFSSVLFGRLQDYSGMTASLADDQALVVVEITTETAPERPQRLQSADTLQSPYQSPVFDTA